MNRNRLAVSVYWCLLVLVCFPLAAVMAQSPVSVGDKPPSAMETWCGWIESDSEHLRWVVRIPSDASTGSDKSGADGFGTVAILDRNATPLPLTQLKVDKEVWSFQWTASGANNQSLSFGGLVAEPNRVIGSLNIGNQLVPSFLQKVDSLPTENNTTLGADIVWVDDSPALPKANAQPVFDMRFRFYTNPPFSEGKPRILFDSLKNGIVGQPASLSVEESPLLEFTIPGIELSYRATLNREEDRLTGTLTRNGDRQALVMKRIHSTPGTTTVPASKEMKASTEDPKKRASPSPNKLRANNDKETDAVRIKMEESPIPPTVPLEENEKELRITIPSGSSSKGAKDTSPAQSAINTLVGTLLLPKSSGTPNADVPNEKTKPLYPVVIIVSDFGLQDRDGTMGNVKPYRTWAQSLCDFGIASFRFDDHGVGASSIAPTSFTTQDLAKELATVIATVRKQSNIDPKRIGLLGHGEGAIAVTMAAVTDPSITCLALIAPPGVKGGELLLDQGLRMAQLEKMKPRERTILSTLQKNLQVLSRMEYADSSQRKRAVRQMLAQSWDELISTLDEKKTAEEWSEMQEAMVEQLDTELLELSSTWNKFFLDFDPTSQWMMLRTPTLALWGGNDSHVSAEINRAPLQQSATRNGRLDVTWEVVPGINHWLQDAPTGHPSEYETLPDQISPNAKALLERWFRRQL